MEMKHGREPVFGEARARMHLVRICFQDGRRYCPRCSCDRLYTLKDQRYRCSRCRYTFHEFSGRWINHGRLSAVQWMQLVGLFQKGNPVLRVMNEMGCSYGAAFEAVRVLRLAILANSEDAGMLMGEGSPFRRNPSRYRDVPVFGVWWRNGQVRISLLPQFSADRLIGLSVSMDRFGAMVFVSGIAGFEGMLFYEPAHLRQYRSVRLKRSRALAAKPHGFWRWARDELARYHGVTYGNFPLYMKELEFRYNRRTREAFVADLLQCLCALKPVS